MGGGFRCLYRQFWGFVNEKPMEHHLDDLYPVLLFTATNFQEPGYHVI